MSRRLMFVLAMLAACEHGKGGGMFPTTDGGGSGMICGGLDPTVCPPDEFCDFGANTCGNSGESGTCRTRPNGCPDFFEPTCGCDGVVHGNPCDANAAGTDINDIGGCEVPRGQFACGHTFCDPNTQYCQRATSDIGGEPASFQCNQLPSGCTAVSDCDCLAGEPCGSLCTGTATGGFEVTCPGG